MRKLPKEVSELPPETREAIRAAILELGEDASVAKIRAKAGGKMATVALVVKLVRSGELPADEPWVTGPAALAATKRSDPVVAAPVVTSPPASAPMDVSAVPPPAAPAELAAASSVKALSLAEEIVAAHGDHKKLQAVALRAAALVVSSDPRERLEPKDASMVHKLLAEARQGLNNELKLGPSEVQLEELVAGEQACELVGLFQGIINGRRRRSILDLAKIELEADRTDFPPECQLDPEKARAKLTELGLDAFGEPVDAAAVVASGEDRTAGM